MKVRHPAGVCLGAFPLGLLFAVLASGQENAVFQTTVALVHVDAEVTSADGRILTGFTKSDFRVFDEGQEEPISQFSAEEQSLDLILLFDISGSMRTAVQKVAAAAREGLHELKPGDRVQVMVFNRRARVIAPFTEDLGEVERAIQVDVLDLRFGGGTFLQSALDKAALEFLNQPKTRRRRAVLIITDNLGQRTRRESSVVRDFWEADALASGLLINSTFEKINRVFGIIAPQTRLTSVGMQGIAEKTGGDTVRAADPGTAFRDSMRRIRSRYSLYYNLPQSKAGTRRSIRVELAADAAARFPKARVRARTGYMTPTPGKS